MQTQNFKEKYYLSSVENRDFFKPRIVQPVSEINIEGRYLLECIIKDSICGYEYDLDQLEIKEIFLVGRFENIEFHKISSYPYYASIMVKKHAELELKSLDNLYNIGWVMIYESIKEAENHKM